MHCSPPSSSSSPDAGAPLSWLQAVGLIVVVWALSYLPHLGTLEARGEEVRRIFPAMSMLETGDWIMPTVDGQPYLRKPPLINWLIAVAFQLTGVVHEWTARLPSVLSVLALALGILGFARRWLSLVGALLAALFILTNIGLLEKGRLAEIEAVYIACFGLALVAWLYAEATPDGSWAGWLTAGLFLGAGLLTKGPLPILVFFYALVVPILWTTGRLRLLAGGRHWCLVAMAVLPFVVWSLAQSSRLGMRSMTQVWANELGSRVVTPDFNLGSYVESILRSVTNFLPWAVFLPLLWAKPVLAALPEPNRPRFLAMRRGLVIAFLAVALLPGARPRYTMPLLVPASLVLAQALTSWFPEVAARFWRRSLQVFAVVGILAAVAGPFIVGSTPERWILCLAIALVGSALCRRAARCQAVLDFALASAVSVVLLAGLYYALGVPILFKTRNIERKHAREIQAHLPPDSPLYAIRPEREGVLFHLGFRVRYATNVTELPSRSQVHVLVRDAPDKEAVGRMARAALVHSFVNREKQTFELWRIDPP